MHQADNSAALAFVGYWTATTDKGPRAYEKCRHQLTHIGHLRGPLQIPLIFLPGSLA